jgi:hypothetical protein
MLSAPSLHTHINSDRELVFTTYAGSEFAVVKFYGDCYGLKINKAFKLASEKCEDANMGFMDLSAIQFYAYALYCENFYAEGYLEVSSS